MAQPTRPANTIQSVIAAERKAEQRLAYKRFLGMNQVIACRKACLGFDSGSVYRSRYSFNATALLTRSSLDANTNVVEPPRICSRSSATRSSFASSSEK